MTDPIPSPQRLGIKLLASPEPGPGHDLEPFIGLFHRFIQERALEGLLIDVADYAHVPNGPGVLLVGHDVDYGVDLGGGRTGLLTVRKRHDLSLPDLVRDTLRKALSAAVAIHDAGVGGLSFGTDAVEVLLFDRLATPNTDAAAEAVRLVLEPFFEHVYRDVKLELARDAGGDGRRPLAFRLTAQSAPDPARLLARLPKAPAAPPETVPAEIEVEDLKRMLDSGASFRLIDVREPEEFKTCNLGGELIPLGNLSEHLSELDRSEHIVVHCKMGGRGGKAAELLKQAGFERVSNVRGGILAWIDRIDPNLQRY